MSTPHQEINISDRFRELSNDLVILFENHSDAVCVFNLRGEIIYANQSVTNLLGYSKDELVNESFQKIIAAEGLDIFNYYFQRAAQTETQEFITSLICKDGQTLEMKISTVTNERDGRIVSISGFFTDITQQTVHYHGKSQTSKELCESFIENNRDPILLLDLEAVIVLANRAFSQLLGWRKENLEGYHILQCPSIPPHLVEQMRDYYSRVVNGDPLITTLETIRINTEGKAYSMMLSITPIHDSNGHIWNWAVHLRDITAQKEAEQSLQRAEQLLALSQLAVRIANEMRDPVAAVKGFLEDVKKSNNQLVYNDGHFAFALQEINRIENLMHDLSLLSNNQSGGIAK